MKKNFIIHPILFALLPILSLLSFNINDTGPRDAVRSIVLSLVGCGLVWFFVKLLTKDWYHAGLITSLFLILFFSYGHVVNGIVHPLAEPLFAKFGLFGRYDLLVLVWFVLFFLGVWVILRLRKLKLELNRIFNLIAIVPLIMPFYTILSHEIRLRKPWQEDAFMEMEKIKASQKSFQPDIYYLVLDGYARSDVLERVYDYDNSSFLDFLAENNFFVANKSRSNYMQTSLSLASSLNMTYLDFLPEKYGQNRDKRTFLARMVRQNEVMRVLEKQGYEIIAFETGYRLTELDNADHYLNPPSAAANILERLLVETSGFSFAQEAYNRMGWGPIYPGYRAHRERIRFVFSRLPALASQARPKFVFAHLILPHPPFVFDSNGQELSEQRPFVILDGDAFPGTKREYWNGYRDQVAYANIMLEKLITDLLVSSERDIVVILQSDHGPGYGLNWGSYEETDLLERTSILNAIYLPDMDGHDLFYEQITPVNTFRLIFNHYFDTDYPLLEDQTFYSTWVHPYLFMPVEQ
jgi:hypothetical protein